MAPLVSAFVWLRRSLTRVHGLLCVLVLACHLVAGSARDVTMVLAFCLAGYFALRSRPTRLRGAHVRGVLPALEIGGACLVGCYSALLREGGGLDGRFSPVLYGVLAAASALSPAAATLILTAGVLALEVFLRRRLSIDWMSTDTLVRGVFLTLFSLLNLVLLRAEAARMRLRARGEVEGEIRKLQEEARSFRLLGTGESRELLGEERLERSSLEEIHQSVHYALELLRRSLGLHTAALFWKNEAGTHFRLRELSSSAENVKDTPIPIGEGVLAVANHRKEVVAIHGLRSSYKLPYYEGSCPVRGLAVIPILDDSIPSRPVRGLLVVDRLEGAIGEEAQELAKQAARYCFRAVENQRVFLHLERAKVEQGKLYRAAQSLGAAITERDVISAGVRAAREVASFDLAAVTVFHADQKLHEVVAALGPDKSFDELVGATFQHNSGLVSMVVQNRFPLPYRGEFDATHQTVLTKRFPWPDMPSLLVLPLLLRDRPLGTLILGSTRAGAFGDSVRSTLEVLASHLAVSLSNARMVQKLEAMATTDGLTGLFNKRALLEAATQKIAAAHRFRRRLSVLVTDIDHFKKVNDTYGHDVGDVVIKGLGDILSRQKRNTDVVARFGGEEFVIVCEETDESGAWLLAERIREELSKTMFESEAGPFAVTCSIGIATLPDVATDWDGLFKSADDALYVSKRGGRNRSTVARARKSERVLVDSVRGREPVSTRDVSGGERR